MEREDQLRESLEERLQGIERLQTELRALLTLASEEDGEAPASERKLRASIETRLGELARLHEELGAVLAAGGTGSPTPQATAAGGTEPYRRRSRGVKPSSDGRAPYGTNRDQILDLALANPGITAPEIAELTGIKSRVVSATVSRLKSRGELDAYRGGVRVPSGSVALA